MLAGLQNPDSAESFRAQRWVSAYRGASRFRRWAAWVTAATLLLAAGFWWLSSPVNAAFAAVQRAQASARELTDRLYRLTVEGGVAFPRRGDGKLYVRGATGSLCNCPLHSALSGSAATSIRFGRCPP